MSTHVKKQKRVWPKVVGIVLLVLILIAAGIAFWQRDNIKAFYISRTSTPEQIAEQTAQTQQDLTNALKEDYGVTIRELTEEEEAKIASGELTVDEIAALLLSDSASGAATGSTAGNTGAGGSAAGDGAASSGGSTSSGGTGTQTGDAGSQQQSPAASIISEGTARMYALKANLKSSLAGIVQEAKDEYIALPAAERTASAKQNIMTSKLSDAAALESECDAQVDQILEDLKSQLTAIGSDTSAADVLRNAYESEKTSTKAYYLSQLG